MRNIYAYLRKETKYAFILNRNKSKCLRVMIKEKNLISNFSFSPEKLSN